MRLNVEVKATRKQIEEVVNNEGLTKSAKIKELFLLGLEVKDIQKETGIVYNMCYNVITNYVLTNGLEVVKEKRTSKKDLIYALFEEGKTNMEVAKETQTNYNYVCKLKKEWKMSLVTNTGADEVAMTVVEDKPVKEPLKERPEIAGRDENGKFVRRSNSKSNKNNGGKK